MLHVYIACIGLTLISKCYGPLLSHHLVNHANHSASNLDHINQHFVRIETDLNYNSEKIARMQSTISGINPRSGHIMCECKVYKILSTKEDFSEDWWSSILGLQELCHRTGTRPYTSHNKVVNNGTPPTWLKALVTPVPKKTPPIDFSHLRPISVTPIMFLVTERFIVSKYLLLALPPDQGLDQLQLAYKLIALIAMTHHISCLLETSSYVRCILIQSLWYY